MRVLIAPDKFKDALTADEVAAAMADGVRAAWPDADVTCCPLGDGGEGTGGVLARALHADEMMLEVLDPLARPRQACWWRISASDTAIIEMAEASGLALLREDERHAMRTSTFGTGQLMRAALDAGARRILLCVGGSATVDGGTGCLQALGWRLIDANDSEITSPATGGTLKQVTRIEPPADWPDAEITVLVDVDNPLLGENGAAAVFAPQKGATPAEVPILDAGLAHWADVLCQATGRYVARKSGSGAAGGLPAGLIAAVGATVRMGFDVVAHHLDLADRLQACDVCLTGEGQLDCQTQHGKVVAGLAELSRAAHKPTIAFVGRLQLGPDDSPADAAAGLGLCEIIQITPPNTPLPEALYAASANLTHSVADYLTRAKPSIFS